MASDSNIFISEAGILFLDNSRTIISEKMKFVILFL